MARGNRGKTPGRGKGWFGDSAGHAAAGRKGGKARARNRQIQYPFQSS